MNDDLLPDPDDSPTTDDGPSTDAPTDDEPSTHQPPPPIRRLRRGDGPLGGVAHGLARYLNLDVTLVRAVMLGTVIFAGFGFWAYVAMWLLIPSDSSPQGAGDPRPLILTDRTVALVFGVLAAMAGLGSIASGSQLTNGGSVLIAAVLIGGGFFLLDQRANVPARSFAGSHGPVPSDRPYGDRSETRFSETQFSDTQLGETQFGETQFGEADAEPSAGTYEWATPQPTVGTPNRWAYEPPVPKPPITSITLGVVVLVLGALALIEQLTGGISSTVYFAVALTILGAGFIAGALRRTGFWLIPFILATALGLAVSTVVPTFEGGFGEREHTIDDAADLESLYRLGAGQLTFDLTDLDLDLTGDAELDLELGAGETLVYVPDDMNVVLELHSKGFVEVALPGETFDEFNEERTYEVLNGQEGDPVLVIDAEISFGRLEIIETESAAD